MRCCLAVMARWLTFARSVSGAFIDRRTLGNFQQAIQQIDQPMKRSVALAFIMRHVYPLLRNRHLCPGLSPRA